MNAMPGSRTAAFLGSAGEWGHYVVASWLAARAGGGWMVAGYLVLTVIPTVMPWAPPRWVGLLAPVGLLVMAAQADEPTFALMLPLAVVIGAGTTSARRTPAFAAGLLGGPGPGAWLGAAGAGILVAAAGPGQALVASAAFAAAGLLGNEERQTRGTIPRVLLPAALVAGFAAGIRVLEVSIAGEIQPSPAFFALAWAIGSGVAWSAAPRTDPRAVLAAPFFAAMALAAMSGLQGPGLIFLHGVVAASVALVAGTPGEAGGSAFLNRLTVVWTLGLGAAWAASGQRLDTTLWIAAGMLILGGFASSVSARRVPEVPEVAIERPSAATERELVSVLAASLRQAREIRADALGRLRQALGQARVMASLRRHSGEMENLRRSVASLRRRLDELETV